MSTLSSSTGTPHPLTSLALPVALIGLIAGGIALQSGLVSFSPPVLPAPETVTIAAGRFEYREAGEFYRSGFAVDAPKGVHTVDNDLSITRFQVSTADYDQCVLDGVCAARESTTASLSNLPATGVSYDNATAYAAWLSKQTGEFWRLPTDVELAYAAGSKFPDDALGIDADDKNPARRWLADYEREAARKASREPMPQSYGHFGENEHGLSDFAGNVWEWTSTCNRRVDLEGAGRAARVAESCGVYIVAGKHRAPLSSFIREPKNGGCAVGTPPDNVGFRLVRDDSWYAPLRFALSRQAL